jgi:hypothetical protein
MGITRAGKIFYFLRPQETIEKLFCDTIYILKEKNNKILIVRLDI